MLRETLKKGKRYTMDDINSNGHFIQDYIHNEHKMFDITKYFEISQLVSVRLLNSVFMGDCLMFKKIEYEP